MSLFLTRSKYDTDESNYYRNIVSALENLETQLNMVRGFYVTKRLVKLMLFYFKDSLMELRLENLQRYSEVEK